MQVTIIDYGLSNLLSVSRAVEKLGYTPLLTDDPAIVCEAQILILPGVGAFGDGMLKLHNLNLPKAIYNCAENGVPILGICLGMQMLFDTSTEFGSHKGLGLIPGSVERISSKDTHGHNHPVPNVGWRALLEPEIKTKENIFSSFTAQQSEVYFVHSYEGKPENPSHILAQCEYGGWRISAAVGNGNVYGTQFHPEKSGPVGLAILNAFLSRII